MRSNFIGGAWVPSASSAGIDVINPATEAVIDRVPAGDPRMSTRPSGRPGRRSPAGR